jgi:hypothetical protein
LCKRLNSSFEIVNEEDSAVFGKKKVERMNTLKKTGEIHGYITSPRRDISSEQPENIKKTNTEEISQEILPEVSQESSQKKWDIVLVTNAIPENPGNNSSKSSVTSVTPITVSSDYTPNNYDEITILESSIFNLSEEIELIKSTFENKKRINNELIQTNEIELELCKNKIISLEKRLLHDEINNIHKNENKIHNNENKIQKSENKIFAKKKEIKTNQIKDNNTIFNMLRVAKIEKNNLEKLTKAYQNELDEISMKLFDTQRIYDEKIIMKNQLEEQLEEQLSK